MKHLTYDSMMEEKIRRDNEDLIAHHARLANTAPRTQAEINETIRRNTENMIAHQWNEARFANRAKTTAEIAEFDRTHFRQTWPDGRSEIISRTYWEEIKK